MTNAITGVGVELRLGNTASPTVYTKIGEVRSISGPEISASLVDATSLDSTGGFKEYIAGIKEGGSVSFEFNYDKDDTPQNTLRDRIVQATQTARSYQIAIPYSPEQTITFDALVESYSLSFAPEDPVGGTISLKMTGDPTWSS